MRKVKKVKKPNKISVETRKGRTAISNCMDSLLILLAILEKKQPINEQGLSDKLKKQLKSVLVSVDHYTGHRNARNETTEFKVINDKSEKFEKIEISSKQTLLTIKSEELSKFLRLMQYFKIENYDGEEQFELIEEVRTIRTSLNHNFKNRVSLLDAIAKLYHDWVPEQFFEKTATSSLAWNEAEMPLETGIKIKSSVEISYVVEAHGEFSKRLLPLYSSPINLEEESNKKKKPQYKVVSLDKSEGKWCSLIELTTSIFVQYYIFFSGYHSVLRCDNCNALFLKKQDHSKSGGLKLTENTCSNYCYKLIRRKKFPNTVVREDCFDKQREWLKDRLFTDSIKETASYCKGCTINTKTLPLSRGECPFLCEKYGETIEAKCLGHNGYDFQKDLCRKRQNKWYSASIGKKVGRRRDECKDCPITLYPIAGDCPFLCEKYGKHLNK